MKKVLCYILLCGFGCFTFPNTYAASDTTSNDSTKQLTILDYFVAVAPEYQTFVKALNESEINATIQGDGPFTVFAPTNAAFTDLPYGNIDELIKPENIDSLQKLITYHIVAGMHDLNQLSLNIKKSGGSYVIQTIGEGGALTFFLKDNEVYVKDNEGYSARLAQPVICQNGLVYAVSEMLAP